MNARRAVPAEFTNLCLLTDGDRVLIQERTDPGWPGVVFPGGHAEQDESFTDGMIREFREETGLTLLDPMLCGVQDWQYGPEGRYVVLLYRATRYTGTLRNSEEGRVRWVAKRELRSLSFAEGFEKILALYETEGVCELYHPDATWEGAVLRP